MNTLNRQQSILLKAVLASLLSLGLFCWGIYQIRHQETRHIELEMKDTAWHYASQFDGYLHDITRVAAATAAYTQGHSDISEPQIYNHLRINVAQTPAIYGAAMAFEPNQYHSKPLFSPYVYRSGKGLQQMDIGSVEDGYDYTDAQWAWWHAPRTANTALWSEPYFDEGAGNVLMATYSVPFHRAGKFWGVTTVDVALDSLQSAMNKEREQDLPFIVLNRAGQYVFHPDADKIMQGSLLEDATQQKNADLKKLWQRMRASDTGVMRVSNWDENKDHWLMFAPIASTDWMFASWVPESDAMFASSPGLKRMTYFFTVALLLVLSGIAYLTWQSLQKIPQKFAPTAHVEDEHILLRRVKIGYILSLLLFLLFALVWFFVVKQAPVNNLAIAAGHKGSESYDIAEAIADIAHKYHPDINIEVLETDGSGQNMHLVEEGLVQLATVQADTDMAADARLIAELYPDAFQLLVRADSDIYSVADLKDHRIALPTKGSGQYKTFWYLANHFGLTESDIDHKSMSSDAADFAILEGAVDAVFRVRAPGTASILKLIEAGDMRLIPIIQAEALQLEQPALESGIVPIGSYRGFPALPDTDLPTAVVQRLLISNKSLDDELVNRITSILFERRRDMVSMIPLAGFISAPDADEAFLPIHTGAQLFYDREEPSFLHENAEPIALILSVAALIFSSLLKLFSNRKKELVDGYNHDLLALCQKARESTRREQLFQIKNDLLDIFNDAVVAEADGMITQEAFELFAFTWKAVNEAVRDRLQIDLMHNAAQAPTNKGKSHGA